VGTRHVCMGIAFVLAGLYLLVCYGMWEGFTAAHAASPSKSSLLQKGGVPLLHVVLQQGG